MKKYNVTFLISKLYNGGMKDSTITKIIEARTISSATNKAKKIVNSNYTIRNMWFVKNVEEVR